MRPFYARAALCVLACVRVCAYARESLGTFPCLAAAEAEEGGSYVSGTRQLLFSDEALSPLGRDHARWIAVRHARTGRDLEAEDKRVCCQPFWR